MRSLCRIVALACMVVANSCTMPVHLFGRYDCRTGASQEQQGTGLVDQLLDEAVKQRVEDKPDGTSED